MDGNTVEEKSELIYEGTCHGAKSYFFRAEIALIEMFCLKLCLFLQICLKGSKFILYI